MLGLVQKVSCVTLLVPQAEWIQLRIMDFRPAFQYWPPDDQPADIESLDVLQKSLAILES